MLKMIKKLINEKDDFLEAAEMILEDGMCDLDDAIILGEDTDSDENELPTDGEGEDNQDDKEPESSEEKNDDGNEDDDKDILDEPIDDEGPSNPVDDSIMNQSITDDEPETTSTEDTPLSIPGDNDLPEPVSNVTGEPIADDGILSLELDLGTNTPKDILPVPPANAGDAVAGDDMGTQRIDSGFGGDDEISSVASTENIEDDLLSEAITIADSDPEEKPSEGETSSTEAPAEGDINIEDPVSEPGDTSEDNPVTAAVKDKVAEAEEPAYDGDADAIKEDLMKKLGNITKNLEDAKRAVMSAVK